MSYTIHYIAYGENQQLKERSLQILNDFFGENTYHIDPKSSDIIFVASGGSEQYAKAITKNQTSVTLLCHRESNSYAAAMEIAAYLRSKSKKVSIIDVLAPHAFREFSEMQSVYRALSELRGQKAALIGDISDWLIISGINKEKLKNTLGINLIHLPWDELEDYRRLQASSYFMSHFPEVDPEKLNETAKVYQLLEQTVKEHDLSAISVECFSMVMRDKVTACLPLAVLSKDNIVAACEGDLCSMVGQMVIRSISNKVPWQANIAEIKAEEILFAHCTAPLNIFSAHQITTHFETNCGTAIQGKLQGKHMAAFRINDQLNQYILIEGEIIDTPQYDFACRTQIIFKTSPSQTELLKNKGLGNHQLIFPAEEASLVKQMMQQLHIEQVL